jgi:hypothetical protein
VGSISTGWTTSANQDSGDWSVPGRGVLFARDCSQGEAQMKIFPGLDSRRGHVGGRFSWRNRTACVTCGVLLSSSLAHADPIRVVGGFFGSGGDDTGLLIESPTLTFSTGALADRTDPVVVCNPCTPGSQLSLSANVTISDWGAGNAIVNGQTFSRVYYGGSLAFDAGSVIVPDVAPQPAGLDGTIIVPAYTTFSFIGTVSGFTDPALTGTPLFTADLVGGGNGPFAAIAGFGNVGSGVFLDFADFHFDQISATPEPGSLLLLGTGVAWCAARTRRRKYGVAR